MFEQTMVFNMGSLFSWRLFLKVFILFSLYFWDVAMSSSVNTAPRQVLRSEQFAPVTSRLTNELSDIPEFGHLESSIAAVMRRYDVKGASVAVVKDGRLVFAKGLGYADAESEEPVEPRHLFRVASISKLITATAIMKMQETGLLELDDRVFGPEGILNDSIYLDYRDPRVTGITVRHLLNHSSGWTRRLGDHMFIPHIVARDLQVELPVQAPDIIRFALNRRLHFNPGSGSSYSNLGYAILGEIIGKLSGQSYEDYVLEKILYPLDIYEMRIGRNLETDRFENEVKYYEQSNAPRVQSFYDPLISANLSNGGNDIETLGAAGGWIASPAEMLKLVTAIDNKSGFYKILSEQSIRIMTASEPETQPIGWAGTDRFDNWWRSGTFAGTFALLRRQNNGITWAVFFNSSTYRGTTLSAEINHQMRTALSRVEQWPDHDLFHHQVMPPYLYPDLADIH
jgi:CubicO group peptidase (beta-lactamase class C family)